MSLAQCNIAGSIASRGSAIISGTVLDNTLGIPGNVMTRNAGNGTMEVRWDSSTGVVDHYDVYICNTPNGTYVKANFRPIKINFAKIYNLPFGATVYTKVRAVDPAGNQGPLSSVAQDAVVSRATVTVLVTGLSGDHIPAGTIFSAKVNEELIGIRTLAAATIP